MPELVEVEGEHFVEGLLRGPFLLRHAKCGDHHAGAVGAVVAMDEGLFARVRLEQAQELCNLFVVGAAAAVRGDADVAHAERFDFAALYFDIFAAVAEIHNHGDTEFFELSVAFRLGLRAAVKRFVDFSCVRKASQRELFGGRSGRTDNRSGSRGRALRRSARREACQTKEQDNCRSRDSNQGSVLPMNSMVHMPTMLGFAETGGQHIAMFASPIGSWSTSRVLPSLTLSLAFAASSVAQLPLSRPAKRDLSAVGKGEEYFDPDEPCPGRRQKTGEAGFQAYVVRTYRHPNLAGCFQVLRNGRHLFSQIGLEFQIGGSPEYSELPAKLLPMGTSLTPNGPPHLVVGQWTGGAHCCFQLTVFELGKNLRRVGHIDTEHSNPVFRDVDGDGAPELLADDWTFAYWKASFAESPAPQIILRFRDGTFHLAVNLMYKKPPSRDKMKREARRIKTGVEWGMPEPPSRLWGLMLDLIYSGNASTAWEFFDHAWPTGRKGKEEFLVDFRKKLSESPYIEDLKALNRGAI